MALHGVHCGRVHVVYGAKEDLDGKAPGHATAEDLDVFPGMGAQFGAGKKEAEIKDGQRHPSKMGQFSGYGEKEGDLFLAEFTKGERRAKKECPTSDESLGPKPELSATSDDDHHRFSETKPTSGPNTSRC